MTPQIAHLVFVGFIFLVILAVFIVLTRKAGIKLLWLHVLLVVLGPIAFMLLSGLFQ